MAAARTRPPNPPHAYEQEIVFMAQERDQAIRTRDRLAADLDLERQARAELVANLRREIDALAGERDRLAASLEHDRAELSQKIAALTAGREQTAAERDRLAAQLAELRESGRQTIETLTRERGEISAQFAQAREAGAAELAAIASQREALAQDRDRHLANHSTFRETHDQQVEKLTAECAALTAARDELRGYLEALSNAQHLDLETARREQGAIVDECAERDAALTALAPFHEAQQREVAALGMPASRKYELASAVADDGLHTVCNAKDLILGRDVEIKVIRDLETSAGQRRELLDEARRLARLQHPNIPAIYEVGLSGTGQVFYSMKAVRGMTMRDMLDQLEHAETGAMLHFTRGCGKCAFGGRFCMARGATPSTHATYCTLSKLRRSAQRFSRVRDWSW